MNRVTSKEANGLKHQSPGQRPGLGHPQKTCTL